MIIIAVLAIIFYLLSLGRGFFIYGGFLFQLAYMLMRGIQLERLPLVGPHDTLFFLSASMVAFAIPFSFAMKSTTATIENPSVPPLPNGGAGGFKKQFIDSVVIMASVFVLFSFLARPHNTPLPPVLKTYWFELHVILAFFSYALFGIAAVLGFLFIKDKDQKTEILQYKAILTGYSMFSMSMIFGGVWAYLAWGTYWLWTPKELWTTILWLFYSLYLHARLRPGWMGKRVAALGIIGFFIVLFTYLGVSLLMKSSHTF